MYSLTNLFDDTGPGAWRVYATVPIVVTNEKGTMGAPTNLACNFLAGAFHKNFPVHTTIFNPNDQKAIIKLYESKDINTNNAVSAVFEESTSPSFHVATIDPGGYYTIEGDSDDVNSGSNFPGVTSNSDVYGLVVKVMYPF